MGLTPERVEPPRRMSHHAERLRHGHPASPRTGRPPNAMVSYLTFMEMLCLKVTKISNNQMIQHRKRFQRH